MQGLFDMNKPCLTKYDPNLQVLVANKIQYKLLDIFWLNW